MPAPEQNLGADSSVESFDNFESQIPPVADTSGLSFDDPYEDFASMEDIKSEESKDSQVNHLEDQDETGTDKGEEESGADKDKKPDSEEEGSDKEDSKGDEKSDDLPEKKSISDEKAEDPEIKTVKAFRDGKAYEVPKDAELKVKIAGKSVKVPVQELMDNYSGKQSWDKKFSELEADRKNYETESKQYSQEKAALATEMTQVRDLAEAGLNGSESPLAFMEKMLDFMGIDTYDYSKNLREYLSEETSLLNQLSPEQRDAYWIQQKNEYLLKKQESLIQRQTESQSQAETQRQVAEMREAHGISQDGYAAASDELNQQGYSEATPQQIIDYAVTKPFAEKSVDLLSQYEEQIDDDSYGTVIREVVNLLKNGTSEEFVSKLLAEEYQVETVMNQVEVKSSKEAKAAKEGKETRKSKKSFESFDDFEDDFGDQSQYY